MKNISIIVENKRATVVGSPVIICGNSDYTVTFTFDAEWTQSGARTARFVYVKGGEVKHEDVLFTGNTVAVPVLSGVDSVKVGVFEGDLCTTTPARIACDASILCGAGVPHDPTPDVYDQIMKLFNDLAAQGAGGATEEQAQQIRQNKQDIAELADGTKNAGDASKLEGHAASYFATAQSVTDLENGTKKAGKAKEADNASKLGGHGAEHFFPKSGGEIDGNVTLKSTDTTNALSHRQITTNRDIEYAILPDGSYGILDNTNGKWIFTSSLEGSNVLDAIATGNLPLDGGGTVSSNNDTPITIKSKTSKNVYQRFVNSEGVGWYFGFDEKGARIVGHGYLIHSGNYSEYALPKTGGELTANAREILTISRASGNLASIVFKGNGSKMGELGFDGTDRPAFWNSAGSSKLLHHDGNSAKVHIGTSAPSDTSALWIDTTA